MVRNFGRAGKEPSILSPVILWQEGKFDHKASYHSANLLCRKVDDDRDMKKGSDEKGV